MKKYILGEVEFVWHDGMCTYYCSELDGHRDMLEQDLIKLGATEVKEDEWVAVGEMHVGGVYDMTWTQAVDNTRRVLNKLIKNQQYLKRRLDERL